MSLTKTVRWWIKRTKRAIEETLAKAKRLDLIESAIAKADGFLDALSELQRRLDAELEYLGNHPGNSAAAAILRPALWWLAFVLIALDIPFQAIVNAATITAIPKLVWLIASPFVAAGIAVAAHGIAVAVAYVVDMAFGGDRPARSVWACYILAGVAGLVSGIAGSILLYARLATERAVGYLQEAAPISLWLVTELMPVLAGCLTAALHYLGHPDKHGDRLREVKDTVAALRRFLDWLITERDKMAPTPTSPPPVPTTTAATVSLLAFLALVCGPVLTLTACSGAGAQEEADVAIRVVAGAGDLGEGLHDGRASLDAPARSLIFSLDETISVESDAMTETGEYFHNHMPIISSAFRLNRVIVRHFQDQPRWTRCEGPLEVPSAPAHIDCTAMEPPPHSGLRSIPEKYLEAFHKAAKREAVQQCLTRERALHDEFVRREQALLVSVGAAMKVEARNDTGTDVIGELAYLIHLKPTLAIVVSDCLQNPALSTQNVPKLTVPDGMTLLVVVLSATSAWGGKQASLGAAEELARSIPGITVVTYRELELNPDLWKELAN